MSSWRRSGRRTESAALVALFALSLWSCRDQPPAQPSKPILRIGTAFGPLTDPLTKEYRQVLPNVDVQSVAAPNSIDVIHTIQSGAADFGVAFSNDIYDGYWARPPTDGSRRRELRGVALLQPLSQY